MNHETVRLYAVAVAAILAPRHLPSDHVQEVLMKMGLTEVEADAVIAHGMAEGLFTEEADAAGRFHLVARRKP